MSEVEYPVTEEDLDLVELGLARLAEMPDGELVPPEFLLHMMCDQMGLAVDDPARADILADTGNERYVPTTVRVLRKRFRATLAEFGRLDDPPTVVDGDRRHGGS